MFDISYETWQSVCSMYFNLKIGVKKAYLQLFPFSKISSDDEKYLLSEDFFSKYIKTGAFVMFPESLFRTENYLQKGDGSFRDSSLISPILYLVLQSIGKEMAGKYSVQRSCDISIYYAGNYEYNRPMYKQDYDDFFKEINREIDKYQYFIKTDISNFYSNINIDKLINQIEEVCKKSRLTISQTQLLLLKSLLQYCGSGKFPLIENSVASSYLATIVYLDPVDDELYKYLHLIENINSFKIIRYVDDMYILISLNKQEDFPFKIFNEIRNEYSSILKKYDLALNTKKCCIKRSCEINEELKKSLYDEIFNDKKCNIEEQFEGKLFDFITNLKDEFINNNITIERYNDLIEDHFNKTDIEFTANEVFNYFVYENKKELQLPNNVEAITKLVRNDASFINLDPKRLTVMILKTHSERAIKAFLDQLFKRNKSGKWNSYDTAIAITYLIQRRFQHKDLLAIINDKVPDLYHYYEFYCSLSFSDSWQIDILEKLITVVENDTKTYFLYFMYLVEKQRNNYLAAFSYYKNYFDRLAALFAFYISHDSKKRLFSYYQERNLIKLYSSIEGSEKIIKKAHKLRNANPLSHATAEVIDGIKTADDLFESINAMDDLIFTFCRKLE